MNIKLVVSYNGAAFNGWQKQPDVRTVEGELEKAINKVLNKDVKLYGAGRTDRGVHAFGQCVNFYADTTIDIGNLPRVINYYLPSDVSVVNSSYVDEDFHARFSAKAKHYRYVVYKSYYRNALYDSSAMQLSYKVDVDKMRKALSCLIGEKDFKSFMGRNAIVKDTIRRVDKVEVTEDDKFIYFDFYGKSFLKNMIRIIVGTVIEIGRGHYDVSHMEKVLLSCNRKKAGPTAPAHGLYLMEIYY